jgi:hypothetical protein
VARNCKRLGPFVLAILAVLALAGCGGSGSSGRIGVGDAGRGILLNYSLLEEYTEFGMNSVLTYAGSSYSADYEVKLYKISYQSIDTDGNPITLSGGGNSRRNDQWQPDQLSAQHRDRKVQRSER